MADTRDKVGRAGVFLAGGVFKTAVYIFIIVFLIWVGKSAYQFGYEPGRGTTGHGSHKRRCLCI